MTAPRDGNEKMREIITPSVSSRVRSELEFHIEMRTRELVESGMTPEAARREAISPGQRYQHGARHGSILPSCFVRTDALARSTPLTHVVQTHHTARIRRC
jgi:hypothetical protein